MGVSQKYPTTHLRPTRRSSAPFPVISVPREAQRGVHADNLLILNHGFDRLYFLNAAIC